MTGMMSNAMYSLGELEAEVTVEQGLVQMVMNLVNDDSKEEDTGYKVHFL